MVVSTITEKALPIPASVGAVLFDVDGTLYTQSLVRRRMLARLAHDMLLHPVQGTRTARFLQAYRSSQERLRTDEICTGERTQLTLACAAAGLTEQEAQKIVEKWMETLPLDLIAKAARPGLIYFLDAAKARGIRCGVVSDYPAEAKLAAMGIRRYFSAVISPGSKAVRRFKPAPDGIQAALAQLGVPVSEAVYVGDRGDVDAEAAGRAGIAAVLIGRAKPFRYHLPVVRNFFELRTLLLSDVSMHVKA